MNVPKPLSVLFLAVLFIACCQHKKDISQTYSETGQGPHYISIDGLWICTPETSLKFPHGTLEPVIQISGAARQDLLVRGCFLWDGAFYDQWELTEMQFNDSMKRLIIVDGNNSTYVGTVDGYLQTITGIVYAGDPDNENQEDSLDFYRADPSLAERLFYPRLPDPAGSLQYVYREPEPIEDGWTTSSVFDFVTDREAFYGLMGRLIKQEFGRLESLLIIKDGKLVLEEYYYGYSREDIHNIHSCTKSVISLLLGVALDQQPAIQVDQPVFSFFPQYDSLKIKEKAQITLEHLLTMTAGFGEEEEPGNEPSDDPLARLLGLPMVSQPGENFSYCNDCSDLLSWVIYSQAGKHADQYAEEILFGPLGIISYYWESENCVPHGHSDLHLLPRDLAKIGQLVLNSGKWKGEQIIPEAWIRESTLPRVAESKYYNYGYHWWHRSGQNTAWWREGDTRIAYEHDKIIALGHGGQYIMILRDLNMVVVTTASDYANGRMARSKVPLVIEEIVPLFENS